MLFVSCKAPKGSKLILVNPAEQNADAQFYAAVGNAVATLPWSTAVPDTISPA